MANSDWFGIVRDYTERLVSIRSVSPGPGEIEVAHEVLRLLHADGMADSYTASGLDPLEGDPYGRQNAYAFLHGQSPATIVLLGHIDTVDTQDYGPLEPWALDPAELAGRLDALLGRETGSASAAELSDWMFGRGAGDMKSGVAINIALMRRLAGDAREGRLPISVVMLATPDEENESAGVLQAVRFLLRLREQYGLSYLGALNIDYVTELYPGDPHRYIYSGSIGKLLPSFLCIGRESHVGLPFIGLDANLLAAELIRDLSMNDTLCDAVPGQIAAPPVTLHATDLKTHYDVQLPFAAYFYLNVLTLTTTPNELLELLRHSAEAVLIQLLRRVDETEQRWRQASGERGWQERFQPRSGVVLSYAELYSETVQLLGEERVTAELTAEWEHWPATLDKRERSLHIVRRLWALSGRQGPAVVIYYAPPYYPSVAPTPGVLQDAVTAVVEAHPELQLKQQPYFPYLSDMSYLRLDPGVDLAALTANMPVWSASAFSALPGSYNLPLEAIQQLALPAINWGPFGCGAHKRDEGVLMSYTFGVLPQLLYETVECLARNSV
ncbi:MAG: M20/M25/M40 family metallo-hydrolase [Chloroflexi bacterium]|nr:M20/M25/M40 family metallo-hydrolase [Chloroflexota bacterium]